jgi:ABC-2 type transport system ATP-binding protein
MTRRNYIEVLNISKSFSETTALGKININVPEQCLYGLIGPDGAGKTTLLRIITTLLRPDQGMVRIKGMDAVKFYRKIRTFIGYMPGRFSLYQDLTVEENLRFYATIFNTTIEENYRLIKNVYSHIEPFRKRLTRNLSGGMKQKLALSCALIHNPEILVLDEPTTGVDAVSRNEFWDILKDLKKEGKTILVSTPYMNEAEMCDYIALMHAGRILEIGIPDNITGKLGKPMLAVRTDSINKLVRDLRLFSEDSSAYLFGHHVHYYREKSYNKKEIHEYLAGKGHHNIAIEDIKANIEDCFITAIEKHEKLYQ